MNKAIVLSNDRGYAFLKKVEGCPDMSGTKSMDVHQEKEGTKTTFTFFAEDDKGKKKVGNMVRNGYLQVSELLGKSATLSVEFKNDGKIILDHASDTEIKTYNELLSQAQDAKKAAKATNKSEHDDGIKKLIDDGVVHVVKPDGKTERLEYVKPQAVKEGDTVTTIRRGKVGTFTVKSVNKEKNVVTATDENKASHFFSTAEVAPVKK